MASSLTSASVAASKGSGHHYFPSEREITLLETVVTSAAYRQRGVARWGAETEALSWGYFPLLERLRWLSTQLLFLTEGYSKTLTSELVLSALEQFDEQVVTLRLQQEGLLR